MGATLMRPPPAAPFIGLPTAPLVPMVIRTVTKRDRIVVDLVLRAPLVVMVNRTVMRQEWIVGDLAPLASHQATL